MQQRVWREKVTGTRMFAKIKELKQIGYKKLSVATELQIDVKTVRKYWDMTEDEYQEYLASTKTRSRIMTPYKNDILEMLKKYPNITGSVIYDRLREVNEEFEPSYRSVRLYVSDLREEEGIPTIKTIRQYTECEELPLGFQAQVDLGQMVMQDAYNKRIKIYIFAMVMSASRHKYVYFQLDPFTSQTFIEAHDRAFKYFSGRTTEIVYDQDRVMVVSENSGDIIFTEKFENYKNYAGFSVHLCRGYDPESKGKIESVVKYVKNNFLKYRVFHGISALNSDGLAWLDRTGNGLIHETTKMIPKVVFEQEKKHLKSVSALGIKTEIPRVAVVRKTNVVVYKQNRYAMPKGTYFPGRKMKIAECSDGKNIDFIDYETKELIQRHLINHEKGKYIGTNHPERDRFTDYTELTEKVINGFGDESKGKAFVEVILEEKKRYARDQLGLLAKLQKQFTGQEINHALEYCMSRKLYSAVYLKDTLEYLSINKKDKVFEKADIPDKYLKITAQKRSIDVYSSITTGRGNHHG